MRRAIALAVLFGLAMSPASAHAIIFGMTSYAEPTADGKHVIVGISTDPIEKEAATDDPVIAAEIRRIRATYKSSGVYPIGDPSSPVWTVPGFIVFTTVSSDGRYGVIANEGGKYGAEACFFDRGRLLRGYAQDDLIDPPSVWLWTLHRTRYDDDDEWMIREPALTYTLSTFCGTRYVFDVTTGEIIHEWRPVWVVYAAIALLIIGGLTTLLIVKRRRAAG